MRIQVRQTGGFAGTTREGSVDTACNPDGTRWEALAEAALTSGAAAPAAGVPDGFRYEVTVEGRTVHFADPDVPEDVTELVRSVLKAARHT